MPGMHVSRNGFIHLFLFTDIVQLTRPGTMWKAAAGRNVSVKAPAPAEDDEWETDPDFVVCRHSYCLHVFKNLAKVLSHWLQVYISLFDYFESSCCWPIFLKVFIWW